MIVPTAMLRQVGLDREAEISVENGTLVVRVPVQSVRSGWAEASQALAQHGDDALVLPEFGNTEDQDLAW